MQFIVGAYFLQFGGYFLTKYYFPKLKPLETLKLYKIVQNNPLCGLYTPLVDHLYTLGPYIHSKLSIFFCCCWLAA